MKGQISNTFKSNFFKIVILFLIGLNSLNIYAQHAQNGSVEPIVSAAPTTCITDGNNIGQHVIDYVLCGASITNPQDTLQGAVFLILNILCLSVSLFMMSWSAIKYIFFTMQKGVPGGDKVQGGIVVLRSAMLITFLVPIVSNGYSPVQVMMRSFTELGATIADSGASVGAIFLNENDGYSNVGLQGVSKVSQQIILSTLCAKNFDIYNAEQVVLTEQYSIQKRIIKSSETITIRWDLQGGSPNSAYNNVDPGMSLNDENGACGEVVFNLHPYLHDKANVSGSTLTFSDLNPTQELYVRPSQEQFAALINHIQEVEQIIADSNLDIIDGVRATAIRSTMDSSRISESEALIASAETGLQAAKNEMRELTVELINSSLDYERAIVQAGEDAAIRVKETDTAYGCLPEGPVNASVYNRVVRYERPDLHLTECAAGGETWADKIAVQGFLVLPMYYTSILEINQRIMAIQKHYASAEVYTKLYSDEPWWTHKAISHIRELSEPYARLASRTNSIVMMFADTRQKTEAEYNFNIVESSRITLAEVQDDGWLGNINKSVSSVGASFTKWITSALVDFADNGDLVLTLINIGTSIISVAEYLAIGLIGYGIFKAFIELAKGGVSVYKHFLGKAVDTVTGNEGNNKDGKDKDKSQEGSLFSIMFWAILFLIILGGVLMYGIPFIVLFKWVLEMQSWAIMMFIACIYAPLWIMAHATITDERFMAEHTLSGYGMMFELTLRPLLLVISFYSVLILMFIAGIAMKMISSTLIGVASGGTNGLLGMLIIAFLTLFAALHLVFRTFDLIASMTDKVLTRFSFGSSPLGDVAQDKMHSSLAAFMHKQTTGGVGAKAASNAGVAMGFLPTKKV